MNATLPALQLANLRQIFEPLNVHRLSSALSRSLSTNLVGKAVSKRKRCRHLGGVSMRMSETSEIHYQCRMGLCDTRKCQRSSEGGHSNAR